jgi:hypothetical protein
VLNIARNQATRHTYAAEESAPSGQEPPSDNEDT